MLARERRTSSNEVTTTTSSSSPSWNFLFRDGDGGVRMTAPGTTRRLGHMPFSFRSYPFAALATFLAAGCSTTESSATGGANDKKTPPTMRDGSADAAPFVCNPSPAAGELYAFEAETLAGPTRSMCEFRGRVLLIVNVASACSYTPQYAPLQTLYEKYRDRGFDVLGFPCNQFGNQESGSSEEISEFCTTKYRITFPMFAKIEVNGAGADPIYGWLKAQPGGAGAITWNFNKFLIGKSGKLIKRFPTETPPDAPEISAAIEAAL